MKKMKQFNIRNIGKLAMGLATAGLLSSAHAFEPKVVTFDNGVEGWMPAGDCGTVMPEGGNPGALWNVASVICGTDEIILQPFFLLGNNTDPAFIGDYTAKGPVRLSIDMDVEDFTYYWMGNPVEEYRQVVFEFVDYDIRYTDPATGYNWPFASVIYVAGSLPNRDAGWKTFQVDIVNPMATELPEGWTGFGGPEDKYYMPQLPPGVTFADIMAGIDEIQIHAIEPGYWYDVGFVYDLNFDNISITELPQTCGDMDATVFVDDEGIVHGGEFDGMPYSGQLTGTRGDDVIVGTPGNDEIQGLGGNDMICGNEGDDAIHGNAGDDFIVGGAGDDTLTGQVGNDFIDGGEGRDVINGGPGSDTCIAGEIVNQCGDERGGHDPRYAEKRMLEASTQQPAPSGDRGRN